VTLRVVGAGLGRTGTASLKLALERLLGAPCYHMREVFAHPEHVPLWHQAALGNMPDWNHLFRGYAATVDWPAASFWPELAAAYPDALVLLSVRDPNAWWESAHDTIFRATSSGAVSSEWKAMVRALNEARWVVDQHDRELTIRAYEAHNRRVRDTIPPDRLLVWQAQDGWAPLCTALGCAVPNEPFPRTNTREEWRARVSGSS
jgi:hypothetical protein